jgi:hypothetical protein
MEFEKIAQNICSKDSKKINDRSGALEVSPRKNVGSTLRKGVRVFASTMPYKA